MKEGKTKSVIITGAGTGIGKATALEFLKQGHKVVLAGRRVDKLEETKAEAGANQANAILVPTDVTDPEQVKKLFAETKAAFGGIDVLFNNAGISSITTAIEDISLESWKAVVDTNLTGMFLCMQEAFRYMKDQDPQGGRIINNGSVSAMVPRPNSIPYTATKHAVTGLTKSASLDGRKYNIACSQIDVGNARTDMTSSMVKGVLQADGTLKPEPVIDVQVVAETVVYMTDMPLDVNVQFMTMLATKMPFIGRG